MDGVGEYIARVRALVAPRSSYATSGSKAKQAVLYSISPDDELDGRRQQLINVLLQTGEFDQFDLRNARGCDKWTSEGNVTIVLLQGAGPEDETASLQEARSLVSSRQAPLVIMVMCPPHGMPSRHPHNDGILVHSLELIGDVRIIATYANVAASLSSSAPSSSSKPAPLGSNGQPSVQSRGQFAYLWSTWQEKHADRVVMLDSGKERVLQRLAERDVAGGGKLSTTDWDSLVRGCLERGLDDWGIYDAVRVRTLGSSLEQDLAVRIDSCSSSPSSAALAPAKEKEAAPGEEGDGRAGFMVKMTLQCVPEGVRRNIAAGQGAALLDYGCAEGAITAELGRQLGLSAGQVFGADVRAIPSDGFTFVPLAAETDAVPAPGHILPSFPAGRFSLITTAMVFHHVQHAHAALLELRRVIAPSGALVLREHHCASAEMAAFLDIMHGLYSLAWSRPVEWPQFVAEYKAWYRPQEAWDALCLEAGFMRLPNAPHAITSAYEQGQRSKKNAEGRYGNLTRAYYAVYLPVPGFALPAVVPLPLPPAPEKAEDFRPAKRPRSDSTPASSSHHEVFESKKYKNQYYILSAGQAVWVKLQARGGGAVAHPVVGVEGIECVDAQSGVLSNVTKINYC